MKRIFSAIIPVVIVLIAFTSCNKETPVVQTSPSDDQVELMVTQAAGTLDDQEVYLDEQSQTLYMQNDGVPADFLAAEVCMTAGDDMISPENRFIRDNSFIHCLRGLSLDDTQSGQVRQTLRAYEACSDQAVQRVRAIYNELQEKYNASYQRLRNAYEGGTLTAERFRAKVSELKTEFRRELRQMQLQEHLDEALAGCLRTCFQQFNRIMTDRQWEAFVNCVNS